ncbi:hypothetical protein E3O44_10860 [Cryobacterium algoricola]|uniref:HEAT repeat domain-containing protein n=1 Tax=Cryobacterium algoricola TaxID=1259183 RepID=A0ABY2IG68_9MICO|nr:hypothetical protein [Cryobacterium algoricola]TFB87584.1 hypothetical protein E3O44_10860 [Cryobacterium algoricola]
MPVLLHWLDSTDDVTCKQELVRALSVPWARDAALGPLVDEFKAIPEPVGPAGQSLRWAIGNALEVLWDDERFFDLLDLARERS